MMTWTLARSLRLTKVSRKPPCRIEETISEGKAYSTVWRKDAKSYWVTLLQVAVRQQLRQV